MIRRIAHRVLPRPIRRQLRRLLGRGPAARVGGHAAGRLGPNDPGGIRRLQVGCGPANLLEDWWNVDIRAFPGVDEVADVTVRWPWRNLDYVYGEHFLEHLPLEGALRFVREAAAAMPPGGVIRLSTPSLEHVWVTHFVPAHDQPDDVTVRQTFAANRAFHGWGHQFLYSRPMLEYLLRACGFSELRFHDYGASDRPALRGLERHGGWTVTDGWPSVWTVEAVRSSAEAAVGEIDETVEKEFVRYVRSGH